MESRNPKLDVAKGGLLDNPLSWAAVIVFMLGLGMRHMVNLPLPFTSLGGMGSESMRVVLALVPLVVAAVLAFLLVRWARAPFRGWTRQHSRWALAWTLVFLGVNTLRRVAWDSNLLHVVHDAQGRAEGATALQRLLGVLDIPAALVQLVAVLVLLRLFLESARAVYGLLRGEPEHGEGADLEAPE